MYVSCQPIFQTTCICLDPEAGSRAQRSCSCSLYCRNPAECSETACQLEPLSGLDWSLSGLVWSLSGLDWSGLSLVWTGVSLVWSGLVSLVVSRLSLVLACVCVCVGGVFVCVCRCVCVWVCVLGVFILTQKAPSSLGQDVLPCAPATWRPGCCFGASGLR